MYIFEHISYPTKKVKNRELSPHQVCPLFSHNPYDALYAMRLPRGTCDQLDKISRKSIWDIRRAKCLLHWSVGKKICQSKERGGLGLRKMSDINEALLLKVVWGLISDASELWTQVLKAKYRCKEGNWQGSFERRKRSFLMEEHL